MCAPYVGYYIMILLPTMCIMWYVIVILQLTISVLRSFLLPTPLCVELPISYQTKFCGHHLLYNLYVSFIKHASELLLDFPKIKALFKQVRVQPSFTTNLASGCLGATLCIINICTPMRY